ncbi:porin family protein [bacterium]|nr:porin family protein [bacterium]
MKLRRIVFNSNYVLSVVVFAALGVVGVQAQTVIEADAPQAIQNRNIDVQPVVVSPGMEPNLVPRNQGMRIDGADGVSVEGAATGIRGDNPGNANTGGVQVQSVTVQANPEMDSTNGYNTVGALKNRRRGVEQDNEARLLEKIEEDRLRRERERTQKVEGIDSSFSSDNGSAASATVVSNDDVPVIAVASAGSPAYAAQPMSSISTSQPASSSRAKIAITPYGGQKWLYDNDAVFSAYNQFTTGVNLEGRISSWFGVEGSVGFSRDEFEYNGYFLPYNPHAQQALLDTKTRDTWEVGANAILGPNKNKFRPYALVGGGVMNQQYDVDDEYTDWVLEQAGLTRATNHFFMNFGGGADYKFSKNFGIGARVDYQVVYGDSSSMMNYNFGDVANRLRYVGSLQLLF